MMPNTLRDRLDAGAPTIGTHFLFNDPDIPELIGATGMFDYAEFTAEYATFDMGLLYHLARAAQCGGNMPLMIKLDQEGQGFWAQAAIGAGFKAVLFTDIRSPDDVDACHRVIAPDNPDHGGTMGVKARRSSMTAYSSDSYLQDLESIVLAIMIEKHAAVENLDAVLQRAREKGVVMTQWGPADYGFSRGQPDLMTTPEIRPYEELVISRSLEHGIRPRIEIVSVDQAQRYVDLGVRDFCIGWDRFIYQQALAELGEGLRDLLGAS